MVKIAFSPDEKAIVAGTSDGTIRVWDLATQTPRGAPLKGSGEPVDWGLALSVDGNYVVSSDENRVLLWDVGAGKLVRTLTDHTRKVRSAAFSPDGSVLVTCDRDSTVIFWDWQAGNVMGRVRPFGDQQETFILDGVTFTRDGRVMAISWSGESGDAMLLDASAHRPFFHSLQSLGTPYIQMGSIAFSPDGQRLAFQSVDGTNGDGEIVQFNLNPASWQVIACRMANRVLTREEWADHVGDRPYRDVCPAAASSASSSR